MRTIKSHNRTNYNISVRSEMLLTYPHKIQDVTSTYLSLLHYTLLLQTCMLVGNKPPFWGLRSSGIWRCVLNQMALRCYETTRTIHSNIHVISQKTWLLTNTLWKPQNWEHCIAKNFTTIFNQHNFLYYQHSRSLVHFMNISTAINETNNL